MPTAHKISILELTLVNKKFVMICKHHVLPYLCITYFKESLKLFNMQIKYRSIANFYIACTAQGLPNWIDIEYIST